MASEYKMGVSIYSTPFLKSFLIFRRIQQYTIIDMHISSCKVSFILVGFQWNLKYFDRF